MVEIEKFIPEYPQRVRPDFSYRIARKEEFNELKLPISEKVPDKPGIPLLSQKLQARFFSSYTDYEAGLMFHGLGTGKSCLASLIVENAKANGHQKRPALVIVPGAGLKKSITKDIAERCTAGQYLPEITETEKRFSTKEQLKRLKNRRINKLVSGTYDIRTLQKFLKKLPPDREIKRIYSNRIIIIDEAHNLRIQTKKKRKRSLLEELKGREPGMTEAMYKKMHHFLHTVENCKIILLTGTPIWDKVYEIASLMNLILPIKQQLPIRIKFIREFFDKDGNLKPSGERILLTRFRGRVSYLRQMETTAKREEIGIIRPWLKYVKVYPSAMSKFQYTYSKEAAESIEKVEYTERNKKTGEIITRVKEIKGGAVRRLARDAAGFIFPGGDYGNDGFKKHIKKTKKGSKTVYEYKTAETKKEIRENLGKYSSKFAAIIDWAKKHPTELIFIYNEFVASGGSGIVNMSLVLQENGFKWARTSRDIRSDTHDTRRFVAISSNDGTTHSDSDIAEIIEIFNSRENRYGQKCQIIMGSRKIAEGFTLKNVRQVHIVLPHWNIPAIEQALGRIFRIGSHTEMPKKEKYVRIFRHIAVQKYDGEGKAYKGTGYPLGAKFTNAKTMDVEVYSIAEEKEHLNTQIYRVLKIISWDCPLTYTRNVHKNDENGTRICDYNECNYRCDGFPSKYIDKTGKIWKYNVPENNLLKDSYNLFYTSEKMEKIVKSIKRLFGKHFNIKLDMIGQLLKIDKDGKLILLQALDYIINSRTPIKNRYGFMSYLKESGNIYFLDDSVQIQTEFVENYYVKTPLITERTYLEDLSEIIQLESDKKYVKEFCKTGDKTFLSRIHYRSLIILIEHAQKLKSMGNKLNKREQHIVSDVLTIFKNNLIKISDNIVIHNMYANEFTGIGYTVSSKGIKITGKMRKFDPKIGEWEYVPQMEEGEYIEILKNLKTKRMENIWDNVPKGYDVYAFKGKDNKFRIRAKASPGKRQTKGAVCIEAGWKIPAIYELFKKVNFFPPARKSLDGIEKDNLITLIKGQPKLNIFSDKLNKYTKKQLAGILTLGSLSKVYLCEILEKWFKDHEKDGMYYDYSV